MTAEVARVPQLVKISSKRQITIPIDCYREQGFDKYALVTWTEKGIEVQPADSRSDDAAVSVLQTLIDKGLEGDALVKAFADATAKIATVRVMLREAEEDVAAGRVHDDLDAMIARVEADHGL